MASVEETQTSVDQSGGSSGGEFELWVIGPDVHHRVPLVAGTITVGRQEQCTIRLDHTSVSRLHLTVFVSATGIHVEDINSRNGTLLNKVRLAHTTRYPLTPSDVVEIGPFRLFLQALAKPAEPVGPDADAPVIESEAMKRCWALAQQVARGSISVLILGETGVGKDVLARGIHRASPRAGAAFVRFNCAAVTESLLESELFGHARGAFTGAVSARAGLVEAADGGTLFLDEVGELSAGLQAKLLHVIETREVTRVGSTEPRTVDVRFVAATHRTLDERSGFRKDLYYRLAGATLDVPPLRERREDVLPLAMRFLATSAAGLKRSTPSLSDAAKRQLGAHSWPGNVRELRNVMERAVLTTSGSVIESISFEAPNASEPPVEAKGDDLVGAGTFQLTDAELAERSRIIDALEACAGNQTRAAKMLGWARSTLAAKLVTYRIPRPRA